jgi:anti-anti-sigma regulatory factor
MKTRIDVVSRECVKSETMRLPLDDFVVVLNITLSGGVRVARNFRICVFRNDNYIRLQLAGDFDASSAFELINFLKEKCDGVALIFVDTTELSHIYDFGKSVFENNLFALRGQPRRFILTGRKANQMISKGNKLFEISG